MEVFYQAGMDFTSRRFRVHSFKNIDFPAHLHNSYELLFLSEGEVAVTVNGVTERLSPGDVAVVLPNDVHGYATTGRSQGFLLFFAENLIGELQRIFSRYTLDGHVFHLPDSGAEAFYKKFTRKANNRYAAFLSTGYVNTLFYEILSSARLTEQKKGVAADLLKRLLVHIQDEYDKGVNLNETASALGLSRSYVSKFFRGAVGCGFNEYVNRLRVEKAKSLLSAGTLGVLDIAMECGFDGQRSFDRVFRKYAGMTPTQFKKQ